MATKDDWQFGLVYAAQTAHEEKTRATIDRACRIATTTANKLFDSAVELYKGRATEGSFEVLRLAALAKKKADSMAEVASTIDVNGDLEAFGKLVDEVAADTEHAARQYMNVRNERTLASLH